ncbi:MAG: hypothetical protein JWL89_204 [Candidatus Saccharibacteria bacterium]|nr:hypothetical protein [Candidatus Saccharibacteria bacterium]
MEETSETQASSPEEIRAEQIMERMRERGFYAECFGYTNRGELKEERFYALVLPQADFDAELGKANQSAKANWTTNRAQGLTDKDFTPLAVLPWETFIEQKGLVWDCETREVALRAAAAPFMQPASA